MSPETAQYHLMMLRLGQREEYDRELDRILEEEDPLPPLILDLALCMSDVNRTISVLREYSMDHPADQQQVYDMILADLRRKYTEQSLTAVQTVALLWNITRIVKDPGEDPWRQLYGPIDDYDLMEAGILSGESFIEALEAFLRGEAWGNVRPVKPKKKKSILDFFRKKMKGASL